MYFEHSKKFGSIFLIIVLVVTLSSSGEGELQPNDSNIHAGSERQTEIADDNIGIDSTHGDITVYKIPDQMNITDGQKGLWEFVPSQVFQLNSQTTSATLDLTFSVVHNGSMIFFAFDYFDATRADENPSSTADNVDVIMDIDEDNVWDQLNPGAETMDYIKGLWGLGAGDPFPVVYDRYNYDTTFDRDINNGGTSDAIGGGTYDQATSRYFFEMGQQFNSGDSLDVNLEIGDELMYLLNVIVDGESFNSGFPTNGYNFTISAEEINLSPPVIEYLAPADATYFNTQNVDISFSVDKKIKWMGYSLDGNANQTIAGNFSLYSLSEGDHELIIYANDTDGRMSASNTLNFVIDTINPEITVLSPQASTTYDQSQVWLNFTVSEEISWMKYAIDNGANISISTTSVLLDLTSGNYTLSVYVSDQAGNEATTSLSLVVSTDTTTTSSPTRSETSETQTSDNEISETTNREDTPGVENPLPFLELSWGIVFILGLLGYSRRKSKY